MRAAIWEPQQDLFEVSVLEQSASPQASSIESLGSVPVDVPLVLVGRALDGVTRVSVRQVIDQCYRSGRTMVLVPPFADSDLQSYLGTPVDLRVVRRPPTSVVRVVEPTLALQVGTQLCIRSDHALHSALSAGVLAVDDEGKPVLLRFQPKNTSGMAFITTVRLLAYTSLSDEDNRHALLTALLSWRADSGAGETPHPDRQRPAQDEAPSRGEIVPVLLAITALGMAEADAVREVTVRHLGCHVSPAAYDRVVAFLERNGTLRRAADGTLKLDAQATGEAVEALGLHAYARELRDLLAPQESLP